MRRGELLVGFWVRKNVDDFLENGIKVWIRLAERAVGFAAKVVNEVAKSVKLSDFGGTLEIFKRGISAKSTRNSRHGAGFDTVIKSRLSGSIDIGFLDGS